MIEDRELFKDIYRIPSARLKDWDYSWPGWYYLTICTANRECLFGEICNGEMQLNQIGEIVKQEWERSFEIRKELGLDKFVIMPDHIHGIVAIRSDGNKRVGTHGCNVETHGRASLRAPLPLRAPLTQQTTITPISQKLQPPRRMPTRAPKSISSFVAGFKSIATKRINELRKMPRLPVWQTRFYDVIIRDDNELYAIRKYIEDNAKNWCAGETHGYM